MSKPRRIFSAQELADIISAYKVGVSRADIAVQYGFSRNSHTIISKLLIEAGVPVRTYRKRDVFIKDGNKLCILCNEWLPLKSFFKRKWKGKPSTEHSYCKICAKGIARKNYIKILCKKYGITSDQY